jgi:hypothetical protein
MRFRSKKAQPDSDDLDLDDNTDYLKELDENWDKVEETPAPTATARTETASAPPVKAARSRVSKEITPDPEMPHPDAPAGTIRGLNPIHRRSFKLLTTIFAVTAVLIMAVAFRLGQRGQWLPEMPGDLAAWSAAEMPLARSALQILGFPPSRGRRYNNLFNERVEAHLISTATFDAYTEPKMVMAGYGYALTAEKRIPLFDKDGSVRALILRNDSDGTRILMYYWIQYTDGSTVTRGSLRSYADVFPRFRLGMNAVFDPKQSVIVRVYTQVHPADTGGLQARRNMDEIAKAIHAELIKQAKEGKKGTS